MPNKSFISFSINLKEINQILLKHNNLPQKTCSKILAQTLRTLCTYVVKDTPYGKPERWVTKYKPKNYKPGTLKNNWVVTFEGVYTGALIGEDATGRNSTDSINTIFDLYFISHTHFYFTNNTPYAYRVEYQGWSHTQRPEGMLRTNLGKFNGLLQYFSNHYKMK